MMDALESTSTDGDLLDAVRAHVHAAMDKGSVKLCDIARSLGLGARTLQRRLSESGTHFRAIVNDVRLERVRALRERESFGSDAIATAIGYSDARSLRRFFSRAPASDCDEPPVLGVSSAANTAAKGGSRTRA
jgi:transcriptional regulator GlxA family with amidase domain